MGLSEGAKERVAETVRRSEAMAELLAPLRRRGEAPFSAGLDDKALQQAAEVAAALELAAAALDRSGLARSGPGEAENGTAENGEAAPPWVFPGTRDIVPRIHRGMPLERLQRELREGREQLPQLRKGEDGSLDRLRVMPACAPTGGHLAHAVGFAYARRRTAASLPVLAFLDQAASETPDFHEGLNFAGVWDVPVWFVVFGEGSETVLEAADGYGVKATTVASAEDLSADRVSTPLVLQLDRSVLEHP